MKALRSLLFATGCTAFAWAPQDVRADHYSGANITYQCLGGNFYSVTLDLYLDCGGTALSPQSLLLTNDCGVNFTVPNLPLTLTEEVSQLCPAAIANSTCNGGVLQGIRHYQFVTTVFLSPCNDWTIGWSICCRNSTQNVLATPGMYVDATINNFGGLCDNSPVIANNSIPFVCQNDPILYNPGITDPDGNALSFQLISGQYAAPAATNVGYDPGYTAAQPIPGIAIDPATGQLAFTPTVSGNYVVVIEATSYDVNGVAIGTIQRDFIFVVVNCMGSPPVTSGLTGNSTGFIVNEGAIEVCEGLPFCVDIPFTDVDPAGAITLTSNAAALLPGATFTVVGTNPAIGTLCWMPDPAFSPANVLISARDSDCPIPNVASASILITVVQPPAIPPDAGNDGVLSSCTAGPPVALFPLLGGTPDVGGVWTDPDGVVHDGVFTPATDLFGIYTYAVGNGCQTDEAIVTVSANGGGDPGTDGTLGVCTSASAVALMSGLGGTPQAGGAWSGPSPVLGGNYDPATMAPGVYTYTIPGVAPCPAATATVTVTENAGPVAGTNGTLTLCSTGVAVALSTGLGGTPQAGGTWSGPSAVVGGNYAPATMTAGVYTYTVTGTAPCANATATVTVTENTATNAGANGTLTVCSNGAAVALSTGLTGTPQAGGAWSGPSAVVGGNYDPSTMTAGVYIYTVTGTAPCANATATVTVTENAATNAGTNGTLSVCSNGAAVALSTGLGGTPQAGGAWSGPSAVIGGNYDPATMTAGVYTYTVTGTAPCTNATATVTVTENAATNAGTNGTLSVCSNGASVALSAGLGGTPQAGGGWSGPSAVIGGAYDPSTMTAGVYTYTVTGTAPCANATATVTVTENAATDAGANGTLSVCSNGAAVALSTGLTGTPQAGGAWSGPSAVVGGNYDPATMTAGVYTYTVTGTAPCTNATATVTVTENAATNAGTNGTLSVCSNGASVALSTGLGGTPQAGGGWSGPSAVIGGNYDPSTMTAGVYTYTVTGTAPCANATATVTVTENAATNAGTNGTLSVCSTGAAVALSTGLGGTPQPGGAWSGPSAVAGGNYDPSTMTPGVYTYTVTGTAPCANAAATVTVTENTATSAGTNGTLSVCSSGGSVALSTGLGGTPQVGGGWSGPSAVVGGNYDPATMTAGVYTYTVTGAAPCANATATVTVTENAATDAGVNGTLTVCSNGAAVALSTGLTGTPQAGGAWSGPSAVVGGNYDPATMTAGVYTYTVTGTAPCTNATATVTVTENAATNAGTNGTLSVCSNGASVALSTGLGGTPQAGGAWSGPSAVIGGNYDPSTMTAGVYTYTVTGTAPCANATATVTVTENTATNAGANGTLTVCSNGAAVALSTGLTGTPQAGGAWSGPSAVVGGSYDPLAMVAGVYTYTVTGTAPCANATATVTVTENAVPDAGINGTLTLCSNGAMVALSTGLGGAPQAGGAWSGPSAVVGGNFDPTTMTAGVYSYAVTGIAPCTNATATVTVTENMAATAGVNGTLTICDAGGAVALVNSLGGTPQAGGAWIGPSAVVGGNYDPATMTAGVYTYTVTGTAPCVNAAATVTVNETGMPNAGADGTLIVCSNSASADLFSELGAGADAGGTWSGPSAVVANNYDPATMTAGIYTYTIAATAPCLGDAATVTVTENTASNAGTNGTLTICDAGGAVPLVNSLGGTPQAGGAWSGPSAVVGGNYDPSTMTAGVYTYTVTGTSPCVNAAATVTVNETGTPNAGADGTLTLCNNSAVADLFAELGAGVDVGGTWSGPSAVVGNSYDPSAMTAGIYTYTIAATAPCLGDAATVTVTENTASNAGTNGTLTICDAGGAVPLVNSLGGTPQAGGAWSGPSAVVGGNYDPSTMTAGVYTYTVSGTSPCVNAAATVTVNETGTPNAGADGTLTLCNNSAVADLFAELGAGVDVGGTWSGPSAVVGNSYDPSAMTAGIYTYTIAATAPCLGDAAAVTVTESTASNAGTNGTLTICDAGGAVALVNSLGGTPQAGGAWSGPSALVGGNYDPSSMTAGIYTYTVTGTAPCANAIATVTVNETGTPNAGADGTLTLCSNGAPADLFSELGAGADAGGTWSGPSAVVANNYDPATMTAGVYTYTIAATAPCLGDAATVTVTENTASNAGTNGTLTICDAGGAVALVNSLSGTPQAGGAWSGPSAVVGGNYDPSSMIAGVYTYTVTGTAPCANATATVTMNETGTPNAGADGTLTLCSNGAAADLFAELGAGANAGGVWSGPSAVVGDNYDPATMTAGIYTYTIAATAPCLGDAATVTVTENTASNAGTNGTLTICDAGGAVALVNSLSGTPQAGGAWSGPSALVGGNYDPATMTAGIYTYTVTGTAPCANATATVTVNETGTPNAGTDGTLTLCNNSAPADLFAELGAGADAGGTWSGPSMVVGGLFDPGTMTAGTYIYTVSASAPCASASASIQVSIEVVGDAGSDATLTACAGSAQVDLLELVGGGSGGAWSGPSGADDGIFDPGSDPAGAYTYSITGTACPTTSVTVTVTLVAGPDAGADGVTDLCSSSAAIDLSSVLNGTPDAGGTWTDANGIVIPSSFDPSLSNGGVFTYTATGNANCPQDQASATVSVYTAPQAGTSGSLAACASSPTISLFDGLSGTLDAVGIWTAPDGTPHTTVLDPGNDPSGVYTYTVLGTTPCVNASATVTVLVAPVPNAGEDGSAQLCSDNAPVLLTTLLGGSPHPNGAWTDPSGDVVTATIAPSTCEIGTYTYTVTGIIPCGSDQASVTILISAAASAGTNGSLALCENNDTTAALIDVLNGAPSSFGTWTDPDGLVFSGSFTLGEDLPGTYTYSVQAPAPCPMAIAEAIVEVIPVPVAHIDVTGNEGCTPAEVTLSNTYEGSGSCTWILWNGEVIEDCAPFTRVIDEAGTYSATLIVDAGNGCGADTLRAIDIITIHEQPVAGFYFLPAAINTLDPVVQFNNTSTGATEFSWDIAGLASSADVNTSYTFPLDLGAEYTVCLVATASANCTDTICETVTIEDGLAVYVPNTFTPDGSGFNDGFKPIVLGVDPRFYHFDIFDRWGQPLYSTDDPYAEWNGNFTDGTEVPIGVYVWKLRAKDAYTGARIEHFGHVTLLR